MENQEDLNTIEAVQEEATYRYTSIDNNLIRKQELSPNCRLILIYLLSNKEGWKIHMKQLVAHFKPHLGRDKVYEIIDEAIQNGYMKREDVFVKNLKRGCKYFIASSPIFKKSFRHPDPRDTEARGPENQEAKEQLLRKEVLSSVVVVAGARGQAANSDITYMNCKGQSRTVTESEVYRKFLKNPEFNAVLPQAMQITRETKSGINEIYRFIEGICRNLLTEKAKEPKILPEPPKQEDFKQKMIEPNNPVLLSLVEAARKRREEHGIL